MHLHQPEHARTGLIGGRTASREHSPSSIYASVPRPRGAAPFGQRGYYFIGLRTVVAASLEDHDECSIRIHVACSQSSSALDPDISRLEISRRKSRDTPPAAKFIFMHQKSSVESCRCIVAFSVARPLFVAELRCIWREFW